jgi:hypothetical protein
MKEKMIKLIRDFVLQATIHPKQLRPLLVMESLKFFYDFISDVICEKLNKSLFIFYLT